MKTEEAAADLQRWKDRAHVPALVEGRDGEWLVYCFACSEAAGEWIETCLRAPGWWPPLTLRAVSRQEQGQGGPR